MTTSSSKVYDVSPAEGPMCQKIIESFNARQKSLVGQVPGTPVVPIVPRDWQVRAASELLNKHDTIVITATGSGKSLSYLLASIANPGKILLAIFPLLSLMTDQVTAAKRLGITSCRITYQTLRNDPNLLKDIAQNRYELVCASPEFATPENKQFSFLFNNVQFRAKLFGIVIDETHLCYIWNAFRPQYGRLGVLRTLFPNTPIMALSATLSPHVLHYTQKVLKVNTPTGLIKRSIDRPNIYLHCIPIRHGVSSRKDLLFLVPEDLPPCDIEMIPKTMLFMDSRVAVCETATMLIHRLPQQFRNADVICDYSTALSEKRRATIMELFNLGTCRILVCTEAAGMGVDVSDIVRVIQWTIPRHVNLASFWQRAGRCGRNREISGVAILFYNRVQCIPNGVGHPLEIFCETGTGGKVDQILDQIRAFDSGEVGNRKKGTGASNVPLPAVFEQEYGESAELNADTIEPAVHNREGNSIGYTESSSHMPVNTNSGGPNSTQQEILGESQPQQRAKATAPGLKAFSTLDRGILWYLSTAGCRRLTVRCYFNDTNVSPYLPLPAAQSPSAVGSAHTSSARHQYDPLSGPCCDNCVSGDLDLLPKALSSLLPQSLGDTNTTSPDLNDQELRLIDPDEELEEGFNNQPVPRSTRVTANTKAQLSLKLRRFREDVWIREGLNQWMGMFGSSFFLPDKHLQGLVQRCASIKDMDSLAQVLARHKIDLQFSAIGPYAHELLELITSTVQNPDPPVFPIPESELEGFRALGAQPHARDNFTGQHISHLRAQDLNNSEIVDLSHTEAISSLAIEPAIEHAIQDRDSAHTRGPRPRPRITGRPTAALKAEQNRLMAAIEAEAQSRLLMAQASATDGTRWDFSVLGKRSRGRPRAAERHARQLAEAGQKELHDMLLNERDFPLLWQRKLDKITEEEGNEVPNANSPLVAHSQ